MPQKKYEQMVYQTIECLKQVMKARDLLLGAANDLIPSQPAERVIHLVQQVKQWIADIHALPLDKHYAFLEALPRQYAAILQKNAHPDTIRRELLCHLRETAQTFQDALTASEFETILAPPRNSIQYELLSDPPYCEVMIRNMDRAVRDYLQQCRENIACLHELMDACSAPTESPPQL